MSMAHSSWVTRRIRITGHRVLIHQDAAQSMWPGATHDQIDQHIAELMTEGGGQRTVLKDSPRSRVVRVETGEGPVVIKTLRAGGLRALLGGLDHWLGFSLAWREWRGARRLAAAYVRCVEPIAMTRIDGAEWIIMPAVDAVTLADHLKAERDPARRMALAAMVGQQIGRMTDGDLINRDHKSRNLLIDDAAARGKAPPIVIDPAGLRERRRTLQAAKMFALLLETVDDSVSLREAMRCLHEAQYIDPSLIGLAPLIDAAYRAKVGRARFGKDASRR